MVSDLRRAHPDDRQAERRKEWTDEVGGLAPVDREAEHGREAAQGCAPREDDQDVDRRRRSTAIVRPTVTVASATSATSASVLLVRVRSLIEPL